MPTADDSQVLHENHWFRVLARQRVVNGHVEPFYRISFTFLTVACIVQRADGRVALIREYRDPISREIWDLPAGTVDDMETHEESALREVAEETGIAREALGVPTLICRFFASPGTTDQEVLLYHVPVSGEVAPRLLPGHPEPDIHGARWFTLAELEEVARSGCSGFLQLAIRSISTPLSV